MVKPRTLKDMVLSHLDPDPEKAEHIYDNLTNDELINQISNTVFTDFGFRGSTVPLIDPDFNLDDALGRD